MIFVILGIVLVLLAMFAYMYWLADKVDKENEAIRQWEDYQAELNAFQMQYWYSFPPEMAWERYNHQNYDYDFKGEECGRRI